MLESQPAKVLKKDYWAPALITVTLLTLIFFLHWKWCSSYMHFSDEIWQKVFQLHLTWYPFNIRYFTTYSILFLHDALRLPISVSFFIIQFPLMFFLGLVFYRYLRELGFGTKQSNAGVALLFTMYPFMCAFFEPVHTWDDIWAYLFITISLTMVLGGRLNLSAIFFTLGCFAREQSLIFYPMLVYAAVKFVKVMSWKKRILWLLMPLIVYGGFYAIVWQEPDPKRFQLIHFNFENAIRARDTLYSLFISFGFVWVAAAVSLVRSWATGKSAKDRWTNWGAVITVPTTVVLALFFAFTRETRILFPPFVFLLPLALTELILIYNRLKGKLRLRVCASWVIAFAIFLGIGIYLGKAAFPSFEFRGCPPFSRFLAGLHFGMILNLLAHYACPWNSPASRAGSSQSSDT
jgi:hypothetical protein